jgi:hypothetical protein
MKYYIAGPMTGVPQFNIPLFDRVAKLLRESGRSVVSPVELDSAIMREAALASKDGNMADITAKTAETWGDCLARDVKMIADQLDAIVMLPNWQKSRGARLEVFVGLLCGKQFHQWCPEGDCIQSVSTHWVRRMMMENMP